MVITVMFFKKVTLKIRGHKLFQTLTIIVNISN